MDVPLNPLTRRDYVLVATFSLVLFTTAALTARLLSGHESVLPQNSREMIADRDWLVPKIGGEPWLERPPVPDWVICAVYLVVGRSDCDAVARLAAVLVAVPTVLLVASTAALFYGRAAGLIAAGVFATMHEMYSYAHNPEADIFLCLIVTATVAVFARLEFGPRAGRLGESGAFVGMRPGLVLLFFVLLGATNLAKGIIFGTIMAGLPVAGYLLWNWSWGSMKRYVWLWGWLAAVAVGLAWPVAVMTRYPEIVQLWKDHYFGRLNRGYLAEPWWYYAVTVPYVLLPWTVPALVGLWQARRAAIAGPSPERFLWCWALLPPLVFSFADGKHHHYLLQCLAPWAILSVRGCAEIWRWCRERLPGWCRSPWLVPVLTSGIAVLLLVWFQTRYGIPDTVAAAAVVGLAALAFVLVRSVVHPNPQVAFAGVILVVAVVYSAWTATIASYRESYASDMVLVRQVATIVPADAPLLVQYDQLGPLETFWVLYHTPRTGKLVRDPWEVIDKAEGRDTAFVLARRMDGPALALIGTVEPVLESTKTRSERAPEHRRVLYRIRLHPNPPPPPADLFATTRRTLW